MFQQLFNKLSVTAIAWENIPQCTQIQLIYIYTINDYFAFKSLHHSEENIKQTWLPRTSTSNYAYNTIVSPIKSNRKLENFYYCQSVVLTET